MSLAGIFASPLPPPTCGHQHARSLRSGWEGQRMQTTRTRCLQPRLHAASRLERAGASQPQWLRRRRLPHWSSWRPTQCGDGQCGSSRLHRGRRCSAPPGDWCWAPPCRLRRSGHLRCGTRARRTRPSNPRRHWHHWPRCRQSRLRLSASTRRKRRHLPPPRGRATGSASLTAPPNAGGRSSFWAPPALCPMAAGERDAEILRRQRKSDST